MRAMKKIVESLVVACLGVALIGSFSGILPAQEEMPSAPAKPIPPRITTVPGGYHVEWPGLTDVGGIQLKGPLTGNFEITFDVRLDDINLKPQPPQHPDVLIPLADYWIVRGKPERAIPLYRRGLATDPDNFTLQNNMAHLLSSVEGKHAEALDVVDKALENRLDNVTLLDTKGVILMNDGRPDEAVPVLERAVTLSCQGPIYMLHLASALDMDGQETRSRDWFEKARPLLEATTNKLSRDTKEMFDNLKMKFGTIGE